MIEILTSPGFKTVIEAFKVDGARTYVYQPTDPTVWADGFEVWRIPERALAILSEPSEDEWLDRFGDLWWRYCSGTNLEGGPTHRFKINGHGLICWNNPDLPDYYTDEESDGQLVFFARDLTYNNILMYCVEEWGASTPKNVCAICAGLAKLNGMSMSELFAKYLQEDADEEKISR